VKTGPAAAKRRAPAEEGQDRQHLLPILRGSDGWTNPSWSYLNVW